MAPKELETKDEFEEEDLPEFEPLGLEELISDVKEEAKEEAVAEVKAELGLEPKKVKVSKLGLGKVRFKALTKKFTFNKKALEPIEKETTEELKDINSTLDSIVKRLTLQDKREKKEVDDLKSLLELTATQAGEYYQMRCPTAAEAKHGNNWSEVH